MKLTFALLSVLALAAEAKNFLRLQRKLEGYARVTADSSIQFNKCVALKTEPSNDEVFYSDENINYAQRGAIVSTKSFVMFNVCETEYCEANGSDNLYLVDLATYLSATMGYFPKRREMYCDSCLYSQQYCKKQNFWNQQQKQSYFDWQEMQGNQWGEYGENDGQEAEGEGYENADAAQYYEEANAEQNYEGEVAEDGYVYEEAGEGEVQWAESQAAVEDEESFSFQTVKNWALNQWSEVKGWWSGDERRKLQNGYYDYKNYNNYNEPQSVETITCDTCQKYGCFDQDYYERDNNFRYSYSNQGNVYYQDQYNYEEEGQQDEDVDQEELYEWISQLSECMQIEGQDNLYAGFICNGDGSGIEIGVFLDDECTVYNGMVSYRTLVLGNEDGYNNKNQQYQQQQQGNYNNYYDQDVDNVAFLKATNDIVTYPFTHDISCGDSLTYATPWGSYRQSGYYYDNANKASQFCSAMFQGNSVEMADCDVDNYSSGNQYGYQYYGQNAQYDGENDDGQAGGDNYQQDYGFVYSYDLSQQELYNQVTVCQKIKSYNGQYPQVYMGSNGVFTYNTNGLPNYVEQLLNEKDRFIERVFESIFEGEYKGLKIVAFLLGVVFIGFLCLCMLKDCCWYSLCDCDDYAARAQMMEEQERQQEQQPMEEKLMAEEGSSLASDETYEESTVGEGAATGAESSPPAAVAATSLHVGHVADVDDFYTNMDD